VPINLFPRGRATRPNNSRSKYAASTPCFRRRGGYRRRDTRPDPPPRFNKVELYWVLQPEGIGRAAHASYRATEAVLQAPDLPIPGVGALPRYLRPSPRPAPLIWRCGCAPAPFGKSPAASQLRTSRPAAPPSARRMARRRACSTPLNGSAAVDRARGGPARNRTASDAASLNAAGGGPLHGWTSLVPKPEQSLRLPPHLPKPPSSPPAAVPVTTEGHGVTVEWVFFHSASLAALIVVQRLATSLRHLGRASASARLSDRFGRCCLSVSAAAFSSPWRSDSRSAAFVAFPGRGRRREPAPSAARRSDLLRNRPLHRAALGDRPRRARPNNLLLGLDVLAAQGIVVGIPAVFSATKPGRGRGAYQPGSRRPSRAWSPRRSDRQPRRVSTAAEAGSEWSAWSAISGRQPDLDPLVASVTARHSRLNLTPPTNDRHRPHRTP